MDTKTKVYVAVGVILVVLASLWMFSRKSQPANNNNVDNSIQTITDTNAEIGSTNAEIAETNEAITNEVANINGVIDGATEASTLAEGAVSNSADANTAIQAELSDSQNLIGECLSIVSDTIAINNETSEINRGTEQLLTDIEQTNTKGTRSSTP